MKFISRNVHGVIDYITVITFAVLPTIIGLKGIPAYISYALAVIHFLMTVLTDFPLGVFKIIPVGLHRIVETIVGPVLVVLPWLVGFLPDLKARYAFVSAGIVIFLVSLLSDYSEIQ